MNNCADLGGIQLDSRKKNLKHNALASTLNILMFLSLLTGNFRFLLVYMS